MGSLILIVSRLLGVTPCRRFGCRRSLVCRTNSFISIVILLRKSYLVTGYTISPHIASSPLCLIFHRYHRAGAEEWCKKPLEYGKVLSVSLCLSVSLSVSLCLSLPLPLSLSPCLSLSLSHDVPQLQSCSLLTAGTGGVTIKNQQNQSINIAAAYAQSGNQKKDPYQILSRESVQDYCKSVSLSSLPSLLPGSFASRSVHLCEPCCRREHELVAIKRLQKLFTVEDNSAAKELETHAALKSSRKKHKKLKKEKEKQKKIEESAPNPYKELETMTYHPVGSSRVYAFRHEMVSLSSSLCLSVSLSVSLCLSMSLSLSLLSFLSLCLSLSVSFSLSLSVSPSLSLSLSLSSLSLSMSLSLSVSLPLCLSLTPMLGVSIHLQPALSDQCLSDGLPPHRPFRTRLEN
jgi:hypothetical protein